MSREETLAAAAAELLDAFQEALAIRTDLPGQVLDLALYDLPLWRLPTERAARLYRAARALRDLIGWIPPQ